MIIERIYKNYEDKPEELRAYLGASAIGAECTRAIWYAFIWARKPKWSGRMRRLFETGHLAEGRFIDNLRDIGINVSTIDPSTKLQYRATALAGHLGGSIDGLASNLDANDPSKLFVLEFKTHNEKSFSALKMTSLYESKRQHYTQIQVYMGLFKIHQALYLAVNKNTDELYEEFIEFDIEYYRSQMEKARYIIQTKKPPPRINDNPSYYICKFCDWHDVCHESKKMDISCRTCTNSNPTRTGDWRCRKWELVLDTDKQKIGCDNHDQIT